MPYVKLIGSLYDCISNDFFELQMKQFLDDIEETWKMKPAGSEREILQHDAEKFPGTIRE